ncbi:MAG: ankyrin repeat domain-containing protein [Rickettsiaceae bacterium H1]|nr:ankyrin repeat domain-containing protein [Rickettsiaceae bacterium H1]
MGKRLLREVIDIVFSAQSINQIENLAINCNKFLSTIYNFDENTKQRCYQHLEEIKKNNTYSDGEKLVSRALKIIKNITTKEELDYCCMDLDRSLFTLLTEESEKDYNCAKKLLNFGANINSKLVAGNTLLHYAVGITNVRMVDFLLKNGADVRLQNNAKKTPFDFSLGFNHYVIVAKLIVHTETHVSDEIAAENLKKIKSTANQNYICKLMAQIKIMRQETDGQSQENFNSKNCEVLDKSRKADCVKTGVNDLNKPIPSEAAENLLECSDILGAGYSLLDEMNLSSSIEERATASPVTNPMRNRKIN